MNSERRILEKDLISKKTKYAFGTGEMFHVIILSVAFSTITFYYNVKLGLSEQLIGFAWLIFAFWNAINDPLFGLIQDRTKTRWGRRIPYIRFGAPIYGLLFILIWFPLVDVNNEILLFLNLIFILFAFDSIYTIIGLVMYSMPAEMVVTSNARANLMVYVSIFGSLGTLIAIIIPLFLLTGDNTSAAVNPIFLITMISLGIIGTVILVIMSFYLKENIYTQLEEPLGFFDGIKETFKNKPFLIFEANNFSYLIAQTILTTGVFYYIQFVLKLEGILAILPILLFFIMTFVFAQPMSKLVVKYGLKKVYIYSALLAGIGFFIGFFVGKIFIFVLIVFAFIGIGFSGISITQQAIFSDVIDYDEILTQKRRETSYSGINALVTKPSISIANYLFLLTLALYGFQRHLKSQTPSGELGIIVGFTILPGIFLILSALFLLRFPLDGAKWDEQKAQLKRIHDKKEKEYFQHLQTNDN